MRGTDERAAVRQRVIDELAHRGWNDADLARNASIDPGTASDFIAGRRWPRRATLSKIEAALRNDEQQPDQDDTRPLTLQDVALAASRKVGGARGRELGRQADQRGLTLSYTTVDKIIAGTYTSHPKPVTLDALANLSGIPRARVYAAAGVPMPLGPLAQQLPPDADLLSPEQRRVVIAVIREFAKQQRQLYAAAEDGAELVDVTAEDLGIEDTQTADDQRPAPGTPATGRP